MRFQVDLDNLSETAKIDVSGMVETLEGFPKQCREAITQAERVDIQTLTKNLSPEDISSIVILGMGGSGISGDIIRALLENELKIPIFVNKGYSLPAFINKRSLIFAISYSGDTEETLATFEETLRRKAQVLVITSNGLLSKRAKEENLALIEIPQGYQPRAAVGYLSLPILVLLGKLGIVKDKGQDLKETLSILESQAERFKSRSPVEGNQAKQLAQKLYGKIPLIYGSDGITSVAALRWKCEFNENSKVAAFYNVFPELNHNEIVGWQLLKEQTQLFSLLVLRSSYEHERVSRRIEITQSLIKDHLGEITEVWAEGKGKLAQLFSLIYLGDFISVYLALLYGVDPTPVERIKLLKEKLRECIK